MICSFLEEGAFLIYIVILFWQEFWVFYFYNCALEAYGNRYSYSVLELRNYIICFKPF